MNERILTIPRSGDYPREIPLSASDDEVRVWYEEDFGPVEEEYRWDEEQESYRLVSRKGLIWKEWQRRMAEIRARNEKADRRTGELAKTGSQKRD